MEQHEREAVELAVTLIEYVWMHADLTQAENEALAESRDLLRKHIIGFRPVPPVKEAQPNGL